jgi:uncharacterized protein
MVYMSRLTGKPISELDSVRQSIMTILTTSIGDRILYRDFGASLDDMLDQPMNSLFVINLRSKIVDSIDKYEPRVAVKFIDIPELRPAEGYIKIRLYTLYIPNGQLITIDTDFSII